MMTLSQRRCFDVSEQLLASALQVIPLGAQTFSKSMTQWPKGVSPYFIDSASGARVTDVDGNQYVDLINGLCAVTLGHCHPEVTEAVMAQIKKGVIFSLSAKLEQDVARQIIAMVPGVEQVRFGKNASDATAGAVRLARAVTSRDHVAVCGYHGWQDWYIGSTSRWRGVPDATRSLTHPFPYNDLNALEHLLTTHSIAAVVMEAMTLTDPLPGYLEGVRGLCHQHGALLVFDETITGFRFANGGATDYFGVTPDLVTFGKGIANGYPLSAIGGPERLMRHMADLFFSFTFGGECLSLAAASATLGLLQTTPVIQELTAKGHRLANTVSQLIKAHGLEVAMGVSGHPTWVFITIKDTPHASMWELKTVWMQEMVARGVLTFGTHNINHAMTEDDMVWVESAYAEVLPILADVVHNGTLAKWLRCEPLAPLFKVR